jgi:hypothetical protein
MGSGSARQWFLRQVWPTIEPLTAECKGLPVAEARMVLARAWMEAFGVRLPDPTCTDCARALSVGRPWAETLWQGGWADRR